MLLYQSVNKLDDAIGSPCRIQTPYENDHFSLPVISHGIVQKSMIRFLEVPSNIAHNVTK
jgi:hypothetical protein